MVAKPKTIFRLTRKMVPAVRKIFSFAQTVVSGIETMVCIQTMVTTTGTTVTAAQKMVSAAQTMVIYQSNLRHRTFDAKKSFANRRNCEIDERLGRTSCQIFLGSLNASLRISDKKL